MRKQVTEALTGRQWVVVTAMEPEIMALGDPAELRVLAMAKLYTGAPADAARLFRLALPGLTGADLAACLIDGATALSWQGDYYEALDWLQLYEKQPIRTYDAAALETRGYCLWKLRRPVAEVDAAYQRAIQAFGEDNPRSARLVLMRARLLLDHDLVNEAESLLGSVKHRTDVAGYVLACQARIAAARSETEVAKKLAVEAIQVYQATVDHVGSSLEAVARMAILLAQLTSGSERIMWATTAKGLAVSLQMPQLYNEAQALEGSPIHA